MFGFKRVTQYEKDYLNHKKSSLEDLLEIKSRLEKWCFEYDEEFLNLFNSYKNAQNTDYVGLALKRNRSSEKSMEDTINEALTLQQRDLSTLKEKMLLELPQVIPGFTDAKADRLLAVLQEASFGSSPVGESRENEVRESYRQVMKALYQKLPFWKKPIKK